MPLVPTNAMVADPQEMGNIPIQPGKDVYIRDVATIRRHDGHQLRLRLVNGRKSIYIPVVKKDTASTLPWCSRSTMPMPLFKSVVPEDVNVRYEFDESPTVRAAIKSVATEGADRRRADRADDPAFSRDDLRSVIVVLVSIPLSLDLLALVGLWLTGNTHQHHVAGRPGAGHRHPRRRGHRDHREHPRADAAHAIPWPARRGGADAATATARLLAMLCILSVFIPTFIMQRAGPLAVHAADAGGGLRHDRLLPALQHARAGALGLAGAASRATATHKESLFDRFLPVFARMVAATVRLPLDRGAGLSGRVRRCCFGWSAARWARSCFPQVDSGQFVLRFRAPAGIRIRTDAANAPSRSWTSSTRRRGGNVAISMGYVGHGRHQHGDQQHPAVHAGQRRRRSSACG